ncbi:ATP-dependent nuclease [Bacillus paralicheniformis]|uniref:ATP-dependent nuclease n=1 Tax=Bacillus paralicheniformis TaxID=1648923 RepID=UPI0021C40A80|nr:ATP-binding protein [Bacillus paralicheniformis]
MNINLLKNLKEVEIDFSESRLTALIGINGSGKSTILHALACCYKPADENKTVNYKFSQFFTPTIDSLWQGSRFTLYHDYRFGSRFYENEETIYAKNTDRWSPKYDRRIPRDVFFIGISSGVPKIEEEKRQSFIRYSTTTLNDTTSRIIKEKAGYIMNRDYSSYNLHSDPKGKYIGVEYNQAKYSSLSMSAGEQRIFKILAEVYNAPNNSLILIDEIDLLLHAFAFKKLIETLHERAEEKKLQIVFTTHSIDILSYSKFINIRHLYSTSEKTICLTNTKPDTIYRITGESTRPIELFVEDDLAFTIVNHIIESLNMSKYVNVARFGAAENCFTTAAGMLLSNKLTTECLFILDGDMFVSEEDKMKRIKKALTGTTQENYEMRDKLLKHITQFNLPDSVAPEHFIHSLLKELSTLNQIVETAKDIQKVDNTHKYVDDIIERMNYQSKEVGLSKIIDVASQHEKWEHYIAPLKKWLKARRDELVEDVQNDQVPQST